MTVAQVSLAPAPSKAWEPTILLDVVDRDIDLATEILRTFVEDEPEMRRQVDLAASSGNLEQLASAAHAYKGSALAIGALPVAEAAGVIELAARSGRRRLEQELALFADRENHLVVELQSVLSSA